MLGSLFPAFSSAVGCVWSEPDHLLGVLVAAVKRQDSEAELRSFAKDLMKAARSLRGRVDAELQCWDERHIDKLREARLPGLQCLLLKLKCAHAGSMCCIFLSCLRSQLSQPEGHCIACAECQCVYSAPLELLSVHLATCLQDSQ